MHSNPARATALRLAVCSLAAWFPGCVPEIESNRIDTPYPLRNFAGPDTLPAVPEGSVNGIALTGPWRVTSVEHVAGNPALPHLFHAGWSLLATETTVARVQSVPPEWLVPAGLDWRLNRVDELGIALGFGFKVPRGNLDFLHYAFVAAPLDVNRAHAFEALHFRDTRTGLISWSIWNVQLERIQQPPVIEVEPQAPSWPQ